MALDPANSEPRPQQGFDIDFAVQDAARTYARALLGAAKKTDRVETVVEEIDSLVNDVFGQASIDRFFTSPKVSRDEKIALVDRTLAGKASPEILALVKILIRNRRIDILRPIAAAVHDVLDEVGGTIEVTVTSAVPLSDEQKESLKRTLGTSLGKWIRLITKVDESVLGGLVVRVGDTVYDSSVARQLGQLKRTVLDQTRRRLHENADRFATSS